MAKLSQVQKVLRFLQANPNQAFTARQIALAISEQYADDYQAKRAQFANEAAFIRQIVAEIGSGKQNLLKACPELVLQDKPRPRTYCYLLEKADQDEQTLAAQSNPQKITQPKQTDAQKLPEAALYPKLMQFLSDELALYCLRIDEKRSKNNRGSKGNQWLHPDVVAMQAVDKHWSEDVRQCVKLGFGQNVRLWSFEVKTQLNGSNVRESFFQAVSNSSWANEGYLVATSIIGEHTADELRILSALHGIGVIILDVDNPSESEIWLPAKQKPHIDWHSVNRICQQNADFATYIEYVATYYQSGKIFKRNWQR